MTDDECYMKKAIEIAKSNIRRYEYPFGCCIVDGENMVVGFNSCFSSGNPIHHAEINAINSFIDNYGTNALRKATIYTTTEPCVMCMGAINWSGIKRIVYGTSIYDSQKLGFNEIDLSSLAISKKMHSYIEITEGVLHEECIELLGEWKARNDRIHRIIGKGR